MFLYSRSLVSIVSGVKVSTLSLILLITMVACYNCIRFLVVTISMLALVPALTLLCGGVWLVVQDSSADSVVVLVGGGIVVLLACLGCGGALAQSRVMVGIFCTSLLALLVGQVILVVLLLLKVSLTKV